MQDLVQHVRVDNLRRRIKRAVVPRNLVEQAGIGTHHVTDGEEQHNGDHRDQGRDRDVADLLPLVGAVDIRRLVQRGVNTGQHGHIQHGTVTGIFPDLHDGQDPGPVSGRGIETGAGPQQMVDQARPGIDERKYDELHRGVRNKHRDNHQGLHRLAGLFESQLVDTDRDRYVQHCADRCKQQVIQHGVFRHVQERIFGLDQELEVAKPYPVTAENAFGIVKVFERHDQTGHRDVHDEQQDQKCRQRHDYMSPVFPCVLKEIFHNRFAPSPFFG